MKKQITEDQKRRINAIIFEVGELFNELDKFGSRYRADKLLIARSKLQDAVK